MSEKRVSLFKWFTGALWHSGLVRAPGSSTFPCPFDLALKSQERKKMHRIKTLSSLLLNQRLCCCLQWDSNQRFDFWTFLPFNCLYWVFQLLLFFPSPLLWNDLWVSVLKRVLAAPSLISGCPSLYSVFRVPSAFPGNLEGGTYPGTKQPLKWDNTLINADAED